MQTSIVPLPVLAIALQACTAEPELLNSERIEETFGSYGIEVVQNDGKIRRSNLYSLHDDRRICRTYAVVQFLEHDNEHTTEEHAEVIGGGSIGATFKSYGWRIIKQTLYVGNLAIVKPGTPVAQLMDVAPPQNLAMHVYRLLLEKDRHSMEYATIVEVHHPEYLDEAALRDLFPVSESSFLSQDQVSALVSLVTESENN
jgi:hypothetical protein